MKVFKEGDIVKVVVRCDCSSFESIGDIGKVISIANTVDVDSPLTVKVDFSQPHAFPRRLSQWHTPGCLELLKK